MTLTASAARRLQNAYHNRASANFGGLLTPPSIFLAVSTTAPNPADGSNITEPTDAAYARLATVATDFSDSTLALPSVSTNQTQFNFARATELWGLITHAVEFDALTLGTALRVFTLAQPILIEAGGRLELPVGVLVSEFGFLPP